MQVTDEMVERAAKAICCPTGECWAAHMGGECQGPTKVFEARAALEAALNEEKRDG